MLVDDLPRDWTARDDKPVDIDRAPPALVAEEVETPLPSTLEAFVDWRYGLGAPESAWGEPTFHSTGDPAAALTVLTDLPESDDIETLLSGRAGQLFDRMLAAIGLERAAIHLVPFCASRPVTGMIPRDAEDRLALLARHHLMLTAPKRVLLLGQSVTRAILGPDGWSGRGRLQPLNHGSGQSEAVATFPPRFLLTKPAMKAEAWKDLQLLIGEQSL